MLHQCEDCGRRLYFSSSAPRRCVCGKTKLFLCVVRKNESFVEERLVSCMSCKETEGQRICKPKKYPHLYNLDATPRPGIIMHPNGVYRRQTKCPLGFWDAVGQYAGEYLTTSVLLEDTKSFALELCSRFNITGVVGIPRSGLLVANHISLILNIPLFTLTPDGIAELGMGHRSRQLVHSGGKLLVVDDSSNSGSSVKNARHILRDRIDCLFAAVYATKQATTHLDLQYRMLPLPHFFEWHLWGCKELLDGYNLGTDFDGVLCPDFTQEEDDDGVLYLERLRSTPCLLRPHPHPLPFIVTGRLEKYRTETEAWLARHGITHRQLIMGPWETKDARNHVADWKATVIKQHGIKLFVESDPYQAERIADLAKQPVICPQLAECFHKV